MNLNKNLKVDNIAKLKENITKQKVLKSYDFLTEISGRFFGKKSITDISVYRSYYNSVKYDSLEEFQKNFSDSSEFESIHMSSSAKLGESVHLNISYNEFFNGSEFPVSAYISVSCKNKTEVEVEDLLQEIKDFIIDLFSLPEKELVNTDTNNTQPTDKGNEKFWVKHKPFFDFVYLVLGIVISVVTIFGFFKSCNSDTVNDEVNESQTFYSQQNEISTDADNVPLLS